MIIIWYKLIFITKFRTTFFLTKGRIVTTNTIDFYTKSLGELDFNSIYISI